MAIANGVSAELTAGNDVITGDEFDNLIFGTSATLNAGDSIDGGAGDDPAIFFGRKSDYVMSSPNAGGIVVAGPDGTEFWTGILAADVSPDREGLVVSVGNDLVFASIN